MTIDHSPRLLGTTPAQAPAASARSPFTTRTLRYGGDYNPEQWPREVWAEDVTLMQQAGINLVSVNIFSWGIIEPREGEYDFSQLDEIIAMLAAGGIDVDLGTPTASPPAWFWAKYPHARPVTRDGVPLGFGSRGMASPSSPEYRRASTAIAEQLARRYASHPSVVMWHVHNEYGAPISDSYDEASVLAFREWLRARYGSLDAVNAAWGTTFWGQVYGEWTEIDAPRTAASVVNPAQRLDYARFTSDALLECFIGERDAIRRHSDKAITTNFMATSCPSMDLWKWAREVDIVANDHYLTAERTDSHVMLSMDADLTRSLAGGRPWMLMEHSTSAVNWQPRNIAKRGGELARNSVSHLARGADGILFFQFRASRFGAEKFHSAMLPHAGVDSRIWREVVELGSSLGSLGELVGSQVAARVAILWDWESFWASDLEWRPSVDLQHRARVEAFYTALWERNVTVDFAHPHSDLSGYAVVLAPSSYLLDDEAAASVRAFVDGGGTFLSSYFSGIVDVNDSVPAGPHPGQLRDLLGLTIEEFLPLRSGEAVTLSDGTSGTYWTDDVVLRGAQAVVSYNDGPAAGGAAITRNAVGAGAAWYVSTELGSADLGALLERVLAEAGVEAAVAASGLEIITRHGDSADYRFAINHSDAAVDLEVDGDAVEVITGEAVSGSFTVPAGAVRIMRVPVS